MSTRIYTSFQFDDTDGIIQDLSGGFNDASPDTLGLLMCDSQVNCSEVSAGLQAQATFPIVGGTTLSFPISSDQTEDIAAGIMLISKDGLRSKVILSPPLEKGRQKEQMQELCQRAALELGETPVMLMPFFPLVPGFPTGMFITALLEAAGSIPVFGGTTTGDLISTPASIFADGKTYNDRMVLVAFGGNARPAFATCNCITRMSEYMPTVTESEGNIVSRVDEMTFCEYMESLGISPEDRQNGVDALMQYGPIPVRLDIEGQPDDGVPEVSCISYTILDQGSVAFSRNVPQGTRIGVGILRKEDVVSSARQCLNALEREMAQGRSDGYDYDCLLCVSCVARYFVMVGDQNLERIMLKDEIPSSLPAGGYYGFCEIGPTRDKESGAIINRAHSASIVMCAL